MPHAGWLGLHCGCSRSAGGPPWAGRWVGRAPPVVRCGTQRLTLLFLGVLGTPPGVDAGLWAVGSFLQAGRPADLAAKHAVGLVLQTVGGAAAALCRGLDSAAAASGPQSCLAPEMEGLLLSYCGTARQVAVVVQAVRQGGGLGQARHAPPRAAGPGGVGAAAHPRDSCSCRGGAATGRVGMTPALAEGRVLGGGQEAGAEQAAHLASVASVLVSCVFTAVFAAGRGKACQPGGHSTASGAVCHCCQDHACRAGDAAHSPAAGWTGWAVRLACGHPHGPPSVYHGQHDIRSWPQSEWGSLVGGWPHHSASSFFCVHACLSTCPQLMLMRWGAPPLASCE